MALTDAAFIIEIRTASGPFLYRGATTVPSQCKCNERYFVRPDVYNFVVQRNSDGYPEGLVGLYASAP